MGQKTNPVELRLQLNGMKATNVSWYASTRNYSTMLEQDMHARNYINAHVKDAMITSIFIERNTDAIRVNINCAKPGAVTGKGGAGIQELHAGLLKYLSKKCNFTGKLKIIIKEDKKYNANLIAASIARQIVSRVNPKKAMRREIDRVIRSSNVKGIRIVVSGRIGGADIARSEKQQVGRVPLHTLKANIQYCSTTALTTYGIMGIKVWLFIEDNADSKQIKENTDAAAS